MAEATLAAVPERKHAAVGALTHEAIRQRSLELTRTAHEDGAAWLAEVADKDELPVPPDILVRVIQVLSDGSLFQRVLTPELVPDEVFRAAFSVPTMPRSRTPSH